MDESAFAQLIADQSATLAELDALLNAKQTGVTELPNAPRSAKARVHIELLQQDKPLQTRFEDACRRLADAYMQSDAEQRAEIRRLVHHFRGVNACMGIPAEQIRTKIDGIRFRLALIYESIKDLQPDADDAIDQLEYLRRAAKDAGFDLNPHLKEVANVSNNVGYAGKSSMRSLLLAMLERYEGTVRCERCERRYSEDLPACPHCGAPNPFRIGRVASLGGSAGAPTTAFEEEPEPIVLPTLKAIPFMFLSAGGCMVWVVIVIVLIASYAVAGFIFSWLWWCLVGFYLSALGLNRYMQKHTSARQYYDKAGRCRIFFVGHQVYLYFLVWAAYIAGLIWLLVLGFR